MAFCRTSSTVWTRGSSPRQNAVLWSGSAVHWGVRSLGLPAVLLLRSPGCTLLAPVQFAAAFQPQVPFGTPPACGVARGYSCPGARLHFYSYRISEGSRWLIPMACQGVLDGSPALRFGVCWAVTQVSGKSVCITSLACASALSFAFWRNSCSSSYLQPFHSPVEKRCSLCVVSQQLNVRGLFFNCLKMKQPIICFQQAQW